MPEIKKLNQKIIFFLFFLSNIYLCIKLKRQRKLFQNYQSQYTFIFTEEFYENNQNTSYNIISNTNDENGLILYYNYTNTPNIEPEFHNITIKKINEKNENNYTKEEIENFDYKKNAAILKIEEYSNLIIKENHRRYYFVFFLYYIFIETYGYGITSIYSIGNIENKENFNYTIQEDYEIEYGMSTVICKSVIKSYGNNSPILRSSYIYYLILF